MELMLRLPDGTRLRRRFQSSSTIAGLASFLANDQGLDMSCHQICTSFPSKKVMPSLPLQSLSSTGLKRQLPSIATHMLLALITVIVFLLGLGRLQSLPVYYKHLQEWAGCSELSGLCIYQWHGRAFGRTPF